MVFGNYRVLFCQFVGLCLAFSWLVDGAAAQDITLKRLDHDAYDLWSTVSREVLSEDGRWIMYTVQNGAIDGESTMHLFNPDNGKRYSVPRASGASFTYDSHYAIYRVMPEKKELERLRSEKNIGSAIPKPKLQYLELSTGTVNTIENVRSFETADENGAWLAYSVESGEGPNKLKSEKQVAETYEVTQQGLQQATKPLKLKSRSKLALERGEEGAPEAKESKQNNAATNTQEDKIKEPAKADKKKQGGTPMVLVNLATGVQRTYPDVVNYAFSKTGTHLAFTSSIEQAAKPSKGKQVSKNEGVDPRRADGVYVIHLDSIRVTKVAEGLGDYKGLQFSEDGAQLAFLGNRDDYAAKNPAWSVFLAATRGGTAKKVAAEGDNGVPINWWVSPQASLRFSHDGKRLYFDTAPIPEAVLKERKDEKSDGSDSDGAKSKTAKLDLWHWKDPQLQPQQLLQAETERKRRYRAALIFKTGKLVQLATRQIPSISIDYRSPSNIAVANTNMPYRTTLSWDYPGFQDVYIVNLDTGRRERVLEQVKWSATMSPEGKYITWFDAEQKKWFSKSTRSASAKATLISDGIKFPLQDELHDTPNLARAYGTAGWLTKEQGVVVYDRYDLWKLDPSGKSRAVCLTAGSGRQQSIRFRYQKLDSKEITIDPTKTLVLSAFDTKTKASGYYSLDLSVSSNKKRDGKKRSLRRLIMLNERVTGLKKAKQSDRVVFTRSTFRMCADVWTSTLAFGDITRASDINPQQDDYSWGNAELVHWRANDGQKLDGILLKPDDFDPSKKYPMLVYFYERNSDNLHRYYTPAAGRSIICHSFYVSRGYLVFIPDIPYKTGEPGPSAVNAILPGVKHLVEKGFVHEDRIGMQGHSWGGYQTAYLVTQTDMFACAESGAPVSNMTSAYGGIRWGSGMSRMFQYERTQSRIGEDLWSAREKYVANSPLFFADRINTPLLILHNDEDGAVPWYQGIELFVALRRLGRPAWMLNYNGEPHWVMDDYNRRDFATRMQQFFDHYLLEAPEPEWMAVGISAVKKGETYGLELLEPEEQTKDQ
ncbi:prolyl oligopeptidase family serine peptidase [bacterium]|nr:prolyl oligopeptidase family serine peptidase [bacterium]